MRYDGKAYDRWITRHPEDYMPSWMLELEDCKQCNDVLPESIPSHAEWDGDICVCADSKDCDVEARTIGCEGDDE